jgi:hypothetical protein
LSFMAVDFHHVGRGDEERLDGDGLADLLHDDDRARRNPIDVAG